MRRHSWERISQLFKVLSRIMKVHLETDVRQEEANSENFVMGSDAANFVNKEKHQVRSRHKKNVERCRLRRIAFNMECSWLPR